MPSTISVAAASSCPPFAAADASAARAASSTCSRVSGSPASSAARCGETAGPKRRGATSSPAMPAAAPSSSWSAGHGCRCVFDRRLVEAGDDRLVRARPARRRRRSAASSAALSTVLPTPVSVPVTSSPASRARKARRRARRLPRARRRTGRARPARRPAPAGAAGAAPRCRTAPTDASPPVGSARSRSCVRRLLARLRAPALDRRAAFRSRPDRARACAPRRPARAAAKRSSVAVCDAIAVSRSREVPAGTVGGRIACANTPARSPRWHRRTPSRSSPTIERHDLHVAVLDAEALLSERAAQRARVRGEPLDAVRTLLEQLERRQRAGDRRRRGRRREDQRARGVEQVADISPRRAHVRAVGAERLAERADDHVDLALEAGLRRPRRARPGRASPVACASSTTMRAP